MQRVPEEGDSIEREGEQDEGITRGSEKICGTTSAQIVPGEGIVSWI